MRHALARAVILLSIALTLANAECFARCLAQPPDMAAPCHSHSKTQMTVQQHDMQPTAATTVGPAVSPVSIPVSQLAERVSAGAVVQPPLIYDTSPLPLRI
jgi:hypothetical protein